MSNKKKYIHYNKEKSSRVRDEFRFKKRFNRKSII